MIKFWLSAVVPIIAALALTFEGLKFGFMLMNYPGDSAVILGVMMVTGSIGIAASIVTLVVDHQIELIKKNEHLPLE